MPGEVVTECEVFAAHAAVVHLSDGFMLSHVTREVRLHTKRLIAMVTLEQLLTGVDPHVAG